MRAPVTLALLLFAAAVSTPAHAQDKKAKPQLPSRIALANLRTEIKVEGDQVKFSELLRYMREMVEKSDRPLTFDVDQEAYREENAEAPSMLEQIIRIGNLPPKATMQFVLAHALRQLPMKSAYVVRAGRVDIVPYSRTAKEYMLNQTFHAEFNERRLDQALEELSDLTGVSIVLDARAKQKAQTAVSARFHDDVALQDAVRMLSEMAELKIVYLVTGIFVTTPEHAPILQKELQKAYHRPDAPAVPGFFSGPPPDPNMTPPDSPLAPPLPPARMKREAAAA